MNPSRNLFLYFLVIMIALLASCASHSTSIMDKSGAEMALVPAGEFDMMGWDELKNEKNLLSVSVDEYYMDIYEVTNQRYAECVDAGECAAPINTKEYSDAAFLDHPVVFITQDMAAAYCHWRDARLPTKVEWEKAAADELAEVEYFWGDVSPICQVGSRMGAGIDENTDYEPGTQPVGFSSPNAYGLYDMTGGMWEWVGDNHVLDVYVRASNVVSFMRINRLSGYGPLYNRFVCGFRCARTP